MSEMPGRTKWLLDSPAVALLVTKRYFSHCTSTLSHFTMANGKILKINTDWLPRVTQFADDINT